MALETVFIIILTTATAGHIARETSDLHYTQTPQSERLSDILREIRLKCIAETKEAYFAAEDDIGESLEELIIEECYSTDDDN